MLLGDKDIKGLYHDQLNEFDCDDLPGMWERSDLFGGEADSANESTEKLSPKDSDKCN